MAKRHAPIGKECTACSYAVHGQEAEELRSGIEKLAEELREMDDIDRISELQDLPRDIAGKLQDLLDKVDARDAEAFLDVTDGRKGRAA